MNERPHGPRDREIRELDAEAAGPDHERLARLARVTRPVAPPGFTDRVMRAVRADALGSRRAAGRAIFDVSSWFRPGLAGVMTLAALALVLASLVLRSERPQGDGGTEPEMVMHRFELVAPDARQVCLVGDFNAWELCRMPLRRDDRTGAWTVEVPLAPGRHEYMFVVDDNSWITDPAAPVQVDDGFGNRNAVVFL